MCDFLSLKVIFQVKLNMSECLKEPQTFRIKLQGISEEVKVTVETQCQCDCGFQEEFSKHCSGKGNLTCGVCRYSPLVVLVENYKLHFFIFSNRRMLNNDSIIPMCKGIIILLI